MNIKNNTTTLFNLNKFFAKLNKKKQLLIILSSNLDWTKHVRNNNLEDKPHKISYIIEVCYTRTNSRLCVKNAANGKLLVFCSAGLIIKEIKNKYYKKRAQKTYRIAIFKKFMGILMKLKFLKRKNLVWNLINMPSRKYRMPLKAMSPTSQFAIIRWIDVYSYNGCRKKKLKRKKSKKKYKNKTIFLKKLSKKHQIFLKLSKKKIKTKKIKTKKIKIKLYSEKNYRKNKSFQSYRKKKLKQKKLK